MIQGEEKCGQANSQSHYSDFMGLLAGILRNNILVDENVDKIFEILHLALKRADHHLLNGIYRFTADIPWAKHPDATLKFMAKSCGLFKKYHKLKYDDPRADCIITAWRCIYDDCKKSTRYAVQYKDHAAQMFLCCKQTICENINGDDESIAHYKWLTDCLQNYICVHRSCKELVGPVFKACVETWEPKDKTRNQCL